MLIKYLTEEFYGHLIKFFIKEEKNEDTIMISLLERYSIILKYFKLVKLNSLAFKSCFFAISKIKVCLNFCF